MNNPLQPWRHDRPCRDSNPGDLRPRRTPPAWPGQDGIDDPDGHTGGPFAIFVTPADGWAALALWALDAKYLRGLHTAFQMIAVFAPPAENDTHSYAQSVAGKVGAGELDLSQPAVLERLCRAIARYEESHAEAWSEVEIKAGLRLGAARWPAFRAARIEHSQAIPTTTKTAQTADDLNTAELAHIKGKPA